VVVKVALIIGFQLVISALEMSCHYLYWYFKR